MIWQILINFASMNVAEMGMNPAMMAGAFECFTSWCCNCCTLETLAANPEAMGQMGQTMMVLFSNNECKWVKK